MTPSLMGGVCFGAGLGITIFGIMYMFIHDGMVHRRFPVRRALPFISKHTSHPVGGVLMCNTLTFLEAFAS